MTEANAPAALKQYTYADIGPEIGTLFELVIEPTTSLSSGPRDLVGLGHLGHQCVGELPCDVGEMANVAPAAGGVWKKMMPKATWPGARLGGSMSWLFPDPVTVPPTDAVPDALRSSSVLVVPFHTAKGTMVPSLGSPPGLYARAGVNHVKLAEGARAVDRDAAFPAKELGTVAI